MIERDWPSAAAPTLRAKLVATDPVWIGAVKRATLARRGEPRRWRVDVCSQLSEVPQPQRGERQFVLVEVGPDKVITTLGWLCRRRPLISRWRLAVLMPRAPGKISPAELASVGELLREAGAGPLIATPWEIPAAIAWGARFQTSLPLADPWSSLPVAIAAEGWQPRGGRV